MNTTFKRYLISSLTTFLTGFFGTLALQFGNGAPMQFSLAFIVSVLLIGVRAGIKGVVESLMKDNADKTV